MTTNLLSRCPLLTALGLLLIQSIASAAVQPTVAPNAAARQEATRLALLGPGDSVTVQVYGQADMTSTVLVANDGTIHIPLAGAVQVAGITPIDAADRVAKALRDGGYFVNPQVTLTLNNSRSERVSVLGEVNHPGSYAIDPSTSIIDLVAAAGGLTANGADEGFVRRRESDGHVASYTVDLKGPTSSRELPSQRLESGDELYVPIAQRVYVYGEVTTPNSYKVEPGMTVMQAIVRAGGITPRGSEHRVEIKRMGKDGQYVITKAKLNDLVQADDVIRVKESIF